MTRDWCKVWGWVSTKVLGFCSVNIDMNGLIGLDFTYFIGGDVVLILLIFMSIVDGKVSDHFWGPSFDWFFVIVAS